MSKTYIAAGKQIRCVHCGEAQFESKQVLMNTRGATFLKVDWLNHAATTLTCAACGRIEWFQDEPQESN